VGTLGFRVQRYGMTRWGDLFTARQKLGLTTLVRHIRLQGNKNMARTNLLGLSLSRITDISNDLCQWSNSKNQAAHLFTRQAIPMLWDFAETDPFGKQSGDIEVTLGSMRRAITAISDVDVSGQAEIGDATQPSLPTDSASLWFTDPPYYDAVPYADLSDFFFVWLKRVLPEAPLIKMAAANENGLTPKNAEIVQDESKVVGNRVKDRAFFEHQMSQAFTVGRQTTRNDGLGCVIFAHKTTEGWEALLSGLIRGGWVVNGSWPVATERSVRLRSQDSAALATSVHLICRPRTGEKIGDWAQVLRELPERVGTWMARLEGEGVRGADLIFACIGPALEIFSRYSRVETPDGREVPLAEYLEKVWEVVGRAALEQVLGTAEAKARNGLAGALEEDARLTAIFLWTHQSTEGIAPHNGNVSGSEVEEETADGDEEDESPKRKPKGLTLIFDVVRRFAQPLGIRLPDWEDRIIETDKDVVRLLPVAERAKQLFGESGAGAAADEIEISPRAAAQLTLFPEDQPAVRGRGRRRGRAATVTAGELESSREATTLDRVHAAMLLQASGRSQALRNLLAAEQDRGPDFLRLANALSALYPRASEEKRLLDAMLLAVPR
jgi:putative DNA methylase